MAGGLNLAQRMRAQGVDFKKGDVLRVALRQFKIVERGPRKHPRSHLPADPELVAFIKVHGVPTEDRRFEAMQDGEDFEVIEGCRRTVAGRVAEAWLRKHKPRQAPLEYDRVDPTDLGQLYVETVVVSLSDLEIGLRRLNANKARGLPDSPSVLASIVASIIAANKGEPDAALMARIVDAMPRGVTAGVVTALSRWDELTPELQGRFESGDAPIGLLPIVLAARREDREDVLAKALREGVRTAKGASQRANRAREAKDPWSRRMSPRVALKLAAALEALTGRRAEASIVAGGVSLGLILASGHDPERTLERLPRVVADALRKARAAK